MLRAIWKCSKCNHTKVTEYNEKEFRDKKYLDDFIKYSKHCCLKCNTQCSMTITEVKR